MLGTVQRTQMLAQEGLLAQLVKACSRVYDRFQKWNEVMPGECAPMYQAASLLIRRCGPNPYHQTRSSNAWVQSRRVHESKDLPTSMRTCKLRTRRVRARCARTGRGAEGAWLGQEPRSLQSPVICADPG